MRKVSAPIKDARAPCAVSLSPPRHRLRCPPHAATLKRAICRRRVLAVSRLLTPTHAHTHTYTRTGFHDVAHDGALFSPTRKGAFFDGESVDEDIEDELLPQKGAALLACCEQALARAAHAERVTGRVHTAKKHEGFICCVFVHVCTLLRVCRALTGDGERTQCRARITECRALTVTWRLSPQHNAGGTGKRWVLVSALN